MVSTFNIEVYKKVHFLSVIIKRFSKHDFEKKNPFQCNAYYQEIIQQCTSHSTISNEITISVTL